MKHEILLGVLEKRWKTAEERLEQASKISKKIHLDIIDGKFTDNKTFLDPLPIKKYTDRLDIELHLMVKNPIDYVKPWADQGIKRIIGHIEMMPDQLEFLNVTKKFCEAGLALDGPTPLEHITTPLEELDELLIYTSEKVGFSGPPLLKRRLDKVKQARKKAPNLPICVDGGINNKTIHYAKECGATRFVSTSHIFGSKDPKKTYKNLLSCLMVE